MTRQVSAHVLNLMRQWEGDELKAYRDTGGILTIGVGHTGPDVHAGETITEDQSIALLAHDLLGAEATVEAVVRVPLNDNQFGTLVDFVFNLGGGAFRSSTLLRVVNARMFDHVPIELMKWDRGHVNGHLLVIQGLINRRRHEVTLWNTAP